MIVTGGKLCVIGEALFGPRWKSTLALVLEKDESTIHRYADGKINVPRDVRKRMAVLCLTRGAALTRLAVELDPNVTSAQGIAGTVMT